MGVLAVYSDGNGMPIIKYRYLAGRHVSTLNDELLAVQYSTEQ